MASSPVSGARFGDVRSLLVEVGGDEFTSHVRICGEVDLSNADLMSAALQFALRRSALRIVLDMSEVTFLSVSGLRVLLHLRQIAAEDAIDFVLTAPSEHVMRVLEVADATVRFRIDPEPRPAGGGPDAHGI